MKKNPNINAFAGLSPDAPDYAVRMRGIIPSIPAGFMKRFLYGGNNEMGTITVYSDPVAAKVDLLFLNVETGERESLASIHHRHFQLWTELVREFASEWEQYERRMEKERKKKEECEHRLEEIHKSELRREPDNL